MYELIVLPPAARFIKKIRDKHLKYLLHKKFLEIANDPYIGERKTGDLQGVFCYDVYYNKTNYEIAYTVKETPEKIVVVILSGPRENFYEQLKRHM